MGGTAIPNLSSSRERVDGELALRVKVAGQPVDVVADPSVTPTIYNIPAPTAGVEVSQALGTNVKQLIFKVRGGGRAQIAFNSGESSTNYISIPAGGSLTLTQLKTSVTLYVQTDKNNQVIEVLVWT